MRKSPPNPTNARNLEVKFDRGEDVLDYFDVRTARVVRPQKTSAYKKTSASYAVKASARQKAAVRDRAARYRAWKKK
jgi:hypothetical protein